MSDPLVQAAKEVEENLRGELTYLVNAIRMPTSHGHNDAFMIPYSMVTGVDPEEKGVLGKEWKSDEIAVNKWAAFLWAMTDGHLTCGLMAVWAKFMWVNDHQPLF